MKNTKTFCIVEVLICLLLMVQSGRTGQTGKIVGRISDASTADPLPGANVVIEGSTIGAASDMDGDYMILNVPPGTYILTGSMLSYQEVRITNVKVSVDQTTRIDFKLNPTSLELGETITVEAERPLIQKDMTATSSSVSAEEINVMPVENVGDILGLQAGVVVDNRGDYHIRGGRANEIAFLVDGVSVTNPYDGKAAVNVDQNAIQELKVISGTFNAEYGQVMSGIVEVVTKDPEERFHFGGSVYSGDYLSSHTDIFYNINDVNPTAIYNYQLYLTGPLPFIGKKLSYYASFRKFYNDGWMYGQRRFNPKDSSDYSPKSINIVQTGDNQPVPMNYSDEYYGNFKLVFKLSSTIKLNYNFLGNQFRRQHYDQLFKYNPDGNKTDHEYGLTNILDWNHVMSTTTFYTIKLSNYYYDFKSYVYEDPNDPRYANPIILRNREDAYSFLTGGTLMTHSYRSTTVNNAKFDLTSQITKKHQIKLGLEYKNNNFTQNNFEANYQGIPGGGVFSEIDFYNRGKYTHIAIEGAAYLQDKIELNNMTVNAGVRYDYFNSRGKVPTNLRDPMANLPGSGYKSAKIQHQWSPRIGLAFPISASGVIHTSYGHFFQIPPYEYIYKNPRYAVAPGGLSTLMGNSDLKPQTTIIYELGFQQEFMGTIGIDVTGYYKDARNLLGTEIYSTYVGGDRYALYINRDYGNIRGITFSLNKRPTARDHLTVGFDYTFQVAEGNASDPDQQYYNQQSFPPKKSNIQVVPLNWDQRHTINLSATYSHPRIITAGFIAQFQSGLPYTPAIQSLETTFENSGRKPFNYNVDLRISRRVMFLKQDFNIFVKVYNLFDRKNEIDVYTDTGRAGYSLISQFLGDRVGHVNTLDEWLTRPDYYSEPRKILVGVNFDI
jgi:outer membrane receptor protein involved in Fe transport